MSSWLQITLSSNEKHCETLSDFLYDLGAQSITYEDAGDTPLFEPPLGTTPLWAQIKIIALFEKPCDQHALTTQIGSQLIDCDLPTTLKSEHIKNQVWERAWMQHFTPRQFGENLWIYPSWYPLPNDPNLTVLLLDPGLAFGSGTHPTTAMCLHWLSTQDLSDQTVIDYGCGSGILAIAASKLGAKQVYAIDCDPQALIATKNNCEKNGLQNVIIGFPDQLPPLKADLIVANILAGPLVQLAPLFWTHCAHHGQVLLSGILADQAPDLMAAYARWFLLHRLEEQELWCLLAGTSKPKAPALA